MKEKHFSPIGVTAEASCFGRCAIIEAGSLVSVSDLAISVTYRKHCHGEPEQERRKMMDTKWWFRR